MTNKIVNETDIKVKSYISYDGHVLKLESNRDKDSVWLAYEGNGMNIPKAMLWDLENLISKFQSHYDREITFREYDDKT